METLHYSHLATPVGPLLVGVTGNGLAVLSFGLHPPQRLAGQTIRCEVSDNLTTDIRRELADYFAGRRREFSIPLDLRGTDFQRRCWAELLRIPFGETRSYAEIARAVGSPNGYRAVGQANHHNPVAIVVPCHRVLAGGKALGGYGGGLPTKAFLLRLEGASFRDDKETNHAQAPLKFT